MRILIVLFSFILFGVSAIDVMPLRKEKPPRIEKYRVITIRDLKLQCSPKSLDDQTKIEIKAPGCVAYTELLNPSSPESRIGYQIWIPAPCTVKEEQILEGYVLERPFRPTNFAACEMREGRMELTEKQKLDPTTGAPGIGRFMDKQEIGEMKLRYKVKKDLEKKKVKS